MVVEEEMKNMEAQQGTAATMVPSKDLSHVIKRKRTKRQRPHYSSSDGGGYCQNNARENFVNSTTTTEEDISPADTPTPTTTTTNDEEVDTAKCLLLLSRGHCHKRKQDDDFETPYKYKFSSKIYLETPTENGKAGIYVYECKTCNRKFPSFQALGGHRASHRKPKAAATEERKKLVYSDDEDIQPPPPGPPPIKRSFSTSSLSLHNNNSKSSPKVHECGICGAEFMSGQALGGHMRRHRGAPPLSATNTTLCLGPFSSTPLGMDQTEKDSKKSKGNIVNLSLDLNLPATPEDENNQNHHKLSFPQQQEKQSPLVLSAAPTLVDCHY